MFKIKVTLHSGAIFLYITDDHDKADVRMWELQHDPKVRQALWLRSTAS